MTMTTPVTHPQLTLAQLNSASAEDACAMLAGLYEHSPWVAEQALLARPFTSLAHLKQTMAMVVDQSGTAAQLALIRAHPELAGKAMTSNSLTAESANEQNKAGLTQCTPAELAKIAQLNADYAAKFGFPFILAVRGPRGTGLAKQQITSTFERRLGNHPAFEMAECLRNIHRVVELRVNDKFGAEPSLGNDVWDWCEALAQHSDDGYKDKGQLTVTYLTDAHRACAEFIFSTMRSCGFDDVGIDAVGNVVGIYKSHMQGAKTLLTGSHYDTVRNGGKHDGRLGIFTPMACVRELHRAGKRLPYHVEVVAFSEEEGQRYKATFLGSGALTGNFNPDWLLQKDVDGITMHEAMAHAGLDVSAIKNITRDPGNYLGFVEVHIEQGPVLNARHKPLGVVTGINGSQRYRVTIIGMASHAGTTPMDARRDAACAAAELVLHVEKRAAQSPGMVGTVGMLLVPNGSTNVVPGQCELSLDLRSPVDEQRDALAADVFAELAAICARRGVTATYEQTMSASAAPSDAAWQARWTRAVKAQGVSAFELPSGAGHDAMQLHRIMPQAMLFVRGENSGISHSPLESTTSNDIQLGIDAFMHLLNQLETEQASA
jgi:beta-ureidopropionase / N-carbamoyl-L-amino-acid hydrolase